VCAPIVLAAILTAAAQAVPGAAARRAGATVRGRVEIRRASPPIERRPTVNDLGMPGPRDLPDRRRSVVYLETAPRGAFEETPDRESRRASMDQRNETFVPYVLAIMAGTTVDFPNSDRTYHNVFSLSKIRRFDLGRYAAGGSKSVRFDRPGIVRVCCDIHSHMSAVILVFGHRYFAVTDAEGRYRIDGVPSGTYTVVSWNDGMPRDSRIVTVPEDGSAVELDFVVR
jgi:plastocyanin